MGARGADRKPMLDGDKELDVGTVPSRHDAAWRLLAAAVLAVSAGFVAWLVQLGS